jgi:ATP-binding protein involved in chromosome partitioning
MAGTAEGRKQAMQEEDRRITEVLSRIKNKLLVLSGKGGVGKSTVAVNLAVALSARGHEVGLMDVDLHGPDTLKMLGREGEKLHSNGNALIPLEYDGHLQVISISSLLQDSDSAVIWRGPLKIKAIKQFIADVAWRDLDYLIIDSPPGTGDEPLTVAQVIKGAKAVVVTTPQDVSILDIRKSITFCRQLSIPVLGIIENMSGMVCPYCHKPIDLFLSGGGQRAAAEMDVPFLGKVPIDPDIVQDGDRGKPYVISHRDSDAARSFCGIVDQLTTANGESSTAKE